MYLKKSRIINFFSASSGFTTQYCFLFLMLKAHHRFKFCHNVKMYMFVYLLFIYLFKNLKVVSIILFVSFCNLIFYSTLYFGVQCLFLCTPTSLSHQMLTALGRSWAWAKGFSVAETHPKGANSQVLFKIWHFYHRFFSLLLIFKIFC